MHNLIVTVATSIDKIIGALVQEAVLVINAIARIWIINLALAITRSKTIMQMIMDVCALAFVLVTQATHDFHGYTDDWYATHVHPQESDHIEWPLSPQQQQQHGQSHPEPGATQPQPGINQVASAKYPYCSPMPEAFEDDKSMSRIAKDIAKGLKKNETDSYGSMCPDNLKHTCKHPHHK